MGVGICLGLAGAFFQSLAYVFSKVCLIKTNMTPLRFLMTSHFVIAVFSLVILAFVGVDLPSNNSWVFYAGGGATAYFLGQLALIKALSKCDPSRVSALLGLKVPILAMISLTFMGKNFASLQWIAIGLIILSAFILSRVGGKLSKSGLILIILATFGYSLSDIGATNLVKSFTHLSAAKATMVSVCLTYISCGIMTVVYFLFSKAPRQVELKGVLPYSIVWFTSFVFLFSSFLSIGFVGGNIAQSSRGVISIVLGIIIAGMGMKELEEKISKKVFSARMLSGLVMLLAIGAFAASQS